VLEQSNRGSNPRFRTKQAHVPRHGQRLCAFRTVRGDRGRLTWRSGAGPECAGPMPGSDVRVPALDRRPRFVLNSVATMKSHSAQIISSAARPFRASSVTSTRTARMPLHWRQNTFGHVRSLITIGHPPRDPTRSRDRRGRRFCAARRNFRTCRTADECPSIGSAPGCLNVGSALQYAVARGEPGVQDLLGPAWRRLRPLENPSMSSPSVHRATASRFVSRDGSG